jgi:hypothetical protein
MSGVKNLAVTAVGYVAPAAGGPCRLSTTVRSTRRLRMSGSAHSQQFGDVRHVRLWGNLGNAASVARLKIIAGCAHVPQLQSPEVFLEAIGDFLPAADRSGALVAKMGG